MKKRIIYLFLALVLVLSFSLVTALPVSADPVKSATLTAPTRTLDVEATFDVPIAIDDTSSDPINNMELNAFNFDITVDTGTLTLNSVSAGTLISGWTLLKSDKTTGGTYPGKDWWTIVGYQGGIGTVSGSGELVVLNFTAAAGFTDGLDTVLHLDACTLAGYGSGVVTIPSTLNDGLATADLLEVTAATVVGSNTATSEGYVSASDENTTFTVTPTVVGGSGTYSTYAWGFGAGGSGTTSAPIPSDVTYSTAGAKSITLTVTDSDGSESAFTVGSIPAAIYNNLVADFSGTPTAAIVKPSGLSWVSTTTKPSNVAFTPGNTGGKQTYVYADPAGWDFNNDATIDSNVASPSFDYATIVDYSGSSGTAAKNQFSVKLSVEDSLVASADKTETDYVTIWRAGNVDVDGVLAASDLTKMARVVARLDSTTFTSDVNDDGAINALDITQTAIYIS